MKTSDEMSAAVFRRIGEYEEKKKKRVKNLRRVALTFGSVLFAVLTFTAVINNFSKNPAENEPDTSSKSYIVEHKADYAEDRDTSGESENTVMFYDSMSGDYYLGEPYGNFDVIYEYETAASLREMYESADLVIMGKYFLNQNTDPEKAETESSVAEFPDGMEHKGAYTQLYSFKVNTVYKGEAEKNIAVSFSCVDVFSYESYELEITTPYSTDVEYSEDYILFLKKSEYGDYYELSSVPGAVQVIDGKAYLRSDLLGYGGNPMLDYLMINGGHTDKWVTVNYNHKDITGLRAEISGMTLDEITAEFESYK